MTYTCPALLDPVQAHVDLSDAVEALADFVELTGAGVLTTMEARGVYDERNPRWQGVFVARGSVRSAMPDDRASGPAFCAYSGVATNESVWKWEGGGGGSMM